MQVHFNYRAEGFDVREEIMHAHRSSWRALASASGFWTAQQRIEIAEQARAARSQRGELSFNRDYPASELSPAALEATRTIAADAKKINRAWAQQQTQAVGLAAYVELAAIVASVAAIDAFAEALGRPHEVLPEPNNEAVDSTLNESVADIGAYLPMQDPWPNPNVSRAYSLVPSANAMFFGNVQVMYTGQDRGFNDMVWDGPLSRPQAELLAARVSSVNECFY